jgi:hypothetical protein
VYSGTSESHEKSRSLTENSVVLAELEAGQGTSGPHKKRRSLNVHFVVL